MLSLAQGWLCAFLAVAVDDPSIVAGRSKTIVVSRSSSSLTIALPDGAVTSLRGGFVELNLTEPGDYMVEVTALSFAAGVAVVDDEGNATRSSIANSASDTAKLGLHVVSAPTRMKVFVGASGGGFGGARVRIDRLLLASEPRWLDSMRGWGLEELLFAAPDLGPDTAELARYWEIAQSPGCLVALWQEFGESGPSGSIHETRIDIDACLAEIGIERAIDTVSAEPFGGFASTIAMQLFNRGDLARADLFLEIAERNAARSSPSYLRANATVLVSIVLSLRGRHGEALSLVQALVDDVGESWESPAPLAFSFLLRTLSLCLAREGRSDEAVAAMRRAHAVVDRRPDIPNEARRDVGISLAYALVRHRVDGSMDEVRALFERWRQFDGDTRGGPDPHSYELGRIARALGHPDDALEYLECAVAQERTFTPGFFSTGLESAVALGLAECGQVEAASRRASTSLATLDSVLDRSMLAQSERKRLERVSEFRELVDLNLSFALSSGRTEVIERAYDQALAFKGRVVRRLAIEREAMSRDVTGELTRRAATVEAARVRSAMAALRSDRNGRDESSELSQRRSEVERAEADFAAAAPQLATDVLDVERLRASLPRGTAAVDVMRISRWIPRGEGSKATAGGVRDEYVAFVVCPDEPGVKTVEFGDAAAIDRDVARIGERFGSSRLRGKAVELDGRDAAKTPRPDALEASLRALGSRLVDPLLRAAPGVTRWIVAPDGALAAAPLDALLLADGRHLVEAIEVCFVSDFGTPPPPAMGDDVPRSALIVGEVDYAGEWGALTGTRREVDLVHALHERVFADAGNRLVLSGRGAGASVVRASVGGRRFVHLATHGFFRSGTFAEFARSGLVLAPEVDGEGCSSLTDFDASWLDLRATELVFLAACSSGAGTPMLGEGVLGLRRSLRLAGARHVIGSLWPIPDDATAEFVRCFYEGVWSRHEPPATALRRAKLDSLADARARGELHDGIRTWGAFVCEGWVRDS